MSESLIPAEGFDREVEDFDRKRYAVYATLIHELIGAVGNAEGADFCRLFRDARAVLGRSDSQLALLFKVSRPTIGRWARGVTSPHPLLRKAVFESLLAEARQVLKALRQPA